MANQATHDDANLILRLYELRREEKLRQAREWFPGNFAPATLEEMNQIAPQGSQENAWVRMVTSYWEMAASFVTSGILNRELFFESAGEMLLVFERLRPVLPALREAFKVPRAFHNMEEVANAYIEHIGPEAHASFQAMVKSAAANKTAAKSA